MSCEHITRRFTFHGALGHTIAAHCYTCGERLSLGPSNDEPAEVQIEMRAAEIYQLDCNGLAYRIAPDDRNGVLAHLSRWDPAAEQWAGWLAREIQMGDRDDLLLDSQSWSWDPSEPVADQGPPWVTVADQERAAVESGWVELDPTPHPSTNLAILINGELVAGLDAHGYDGPPVHAVSCDKRTDDRADVAKLVLSEATDPIVADLVEVEPTGGES
jgi:hypothetical protein